MPDSGLLPSRSQPVVAAARNPHPPLSVQVSNVLSTTISDGGFREALFLVEDRLAGNYLRTKRRLRINILREVIDTNAAILDDFGHVVMQLCQIRSTLTGLNKGFEDMRSQAIVPCLKILPILTDASSLFQKQVRLQQEHKILTALRNHYIMSQEEMAHLTITAKPVDDQFFIALSRAKIINKDCTFLLGFEGQVLGSKVMDQTSRNITSAYHKLYQYIHREFKALNHDNSLFHSTMQRALRTMAERPSLFQQSLELFTEARERYLTDAFLEALAGSESSHEVTATLKPIDLIAHDPTRYVGDMFAWVHSTAVTELEAVDTLFVPASDESTQWIRSDHAIDSRRLLVDTDADAFDAMWTMGYLVDRNVEGISRVLRQRVEHVIHSNEEVTTAYRLVVVIKFYGVTLQKLVGGQSNLLDSIGNLESQALRQFRALVRDNVAHHQMELQHAPSDLGPPVFVHDVLSLLEVILKIYESSVSESHHHDHDISFIISDAFDPCMSACKSIAASLRHPHDTIFVLNCELAAAKIIKKFKFLHKEMNMLQNETSIEAEKLIAYQTRSFRTSSGLDHLLTEPHNINEKALEEASQQLDNFLPSAVMDAMERLDCLLDAELSRFVIQAAAHRFYDDFEQLERSIEQIDKKGVGTDGPRLRTYFPRTLAEIRVLLS